jgi:putative oxidoreductase
VVAYIVAVVCEVGGGIALLPGFWSRAVAVVLALFCLFTAYTVHFVPADVGQMTNFWKNLAMAGGFHQLVASLVESLNQPPWYQSR